MGNVVARRYARALFAIGQKAGAGEMQQYGEELASLAGTLEGSPELLKVFRNPIFDVETKKAVLDAVLSKLNPSQMVKNFCLLLAEKNRLAYLPEIEAVYAALLDDAQGIVRGRMTTAFELDSDRQKAIADKLEAQTKKTVQLNYNVDQEILGGLVLTIGDKVFDASLRAQLDMLKENIKRGE